MYPDTYVLATLRRVGVPTLWLEDALQEVRIREWRAGEKTGAPLLHRWAVDAVRGLPGHHRDGSTDDADSLDTVPPSARAKAYPSDDLIAAVTEINAMPLLKRRAFALLAMDRLPLEVGQCIGRSERMVGQYRRELRESVA